MYKISALSVLFLMNCNSKSTSEKPVADHLETVISLPKVLDEVSGIAMSADRKSIYAIADQGNPNVVYGLDFAGKIIGEKEIENVENIDWEDITSDKNGFTYIGNFGNNENDRKDLSILKIDMKKGDSSTPVLQETKFSYPEQTAFPPKKSELLYDCEGFVVYKDSFYLFTKNRSKNFDGTFLVYKVPNKAGNFPAKLVGKLQLEGNFNDAAITSATISSAENKIVLLSHKNIFVLENFNENDFSKATIKTVSLNHNSQKESIVFKDDKTLLIADEKDKGEGGNVYSFTLD